MDTQLALDTVLKVAAIIGILVLTGSIIYIALMIKAFITKAEQTVRFMNRTVVDSQRLSGAFLKGLRYRLEMNATAGAIKAIRSIVQR